MCADSLTGNTPNIQQFIRPISPNQPIVWNIFENSSHQMSIIHGPKESGIPTVALEQAKKVHVMALNLNEFPVFSLLFIFLYDFTFSFQVCTIWLLWLLFGDQKKSKNLLKYWFTLSHFALIDPVVVRQSLGHLQSELCSLVD